MNYDGMRWSRMGRKSKEIGDVPGIGKGEKNG